MVWLKFYEVEHEYNKDLYEMKISAHQVQVLANKMSRHFKFRKVQVLSNARRNGHAYYRSIDVPKVTNVGLVIHELAHIFNRRKHGDSRHIKKLHTTIKRFSSYFRKHLQDQFSTLMAPQPKPKPTPLEKCEVKLKRTRQRVKRLTTKIKTLKTRLKTAKKKQTYYTRRVKLLRKTQASL